MASTGQAFWYVHTWWRRWTGGKGWHASNTHTADRAAAQKSFCLVTQTTQRGVPTVDRSITSFSDSQLLYFCLLLVLTFSDIKHVDAFLVRGGAAVWGGRTPGSCRHGGWKKTLPPPTASCVMIIWVHLQLSSSFVCCKINSAITISALLHYFMFDAAHGRTWNFDWISYSCFHKVIYF